MKRSYGRGAGRRNKGRQQRVQVGSVGGKRAGVSKGMVYQAKAKQNLNLKKNNDSDADNSAEEDPSAQVHDFTDFADNES